MMTMMQLFNNRFGYNLLHPCTEKEKFMKFKNQMQLLHVDRSHSNHGMVGVSLGFLVTSNAESSHRFLVLQNWKRSWQGGVAHNIKKIPSFGSMN
jgi:hypothetical protein